MNSWHKGHPRDLRKTTTLICSSDGLPIRSSMDTESLLTEKKICLRIFSRGFELSADSEGFPEKMVSWQPQSSITLLMRVRMKLGRLTTMLPDDTRGFLGEKASA
jgi:hypothetical protein